MLPLPKPYLAVRTFDAPFEGPRSREYLFTESFEWGGVDFGDTSEELFTYVWRAWTNGRTVWCQREGSDVVRVLAEDLTITEVDLTFDQNMQPTVSYLSGEEAKLVWYDSAQGEFITTVVTGARNPRVSLDDKRRFNIVNSDIIFAYIRADTLCCRFQRERYVTEHRLLEFVGESELLKVGMGTNLRFLFHVFP